MPEAELFFFELKLKKWRRALAQALQAKMYAHKAYCVFPQASRAVISDNRETFRQLGVGRHSVRSNRLERR
ncbi:MAG: hypothetical protein WDO24_29315 [Pseudomonadota bacterium]